MTSGFTLALLLGLAPIAAPVATVEQKICNTLHETDWETCRALARPDARARCYSSATERHAACHAAILSDRLLPPLAERNAPRAAVEPVAPAVAAIGVVMLRRDLALLRDDGATSPVVVRFAPPVRAADTGDFFCAFQIAGVGDERVRLAWGVDAAQALLLAIQEAGLDLQGTPAAREGRLIWLARGNPLGFTLPAPPLPPARPAGEKK